ncbi:hypothetical protein BOTBODRAFT_176994 [Botryobasidium botryosum FD-172 SS1]|uniref:Uncharacterized protein n=1 Tax=Botryobasidium botryosum (strain FD-172 SS1) TaxID=930990 RepID=A0A067M8B7_BOTB1|nr:hypothetical protein BOTBODRAFT_176994 [Botryobasidium botryosum FD-172 SS1]
MFRILLLAYVDFCTYLTVRQYYTPYNIISIIAIATIYKYGSPASNDPASSPGAGSPNIYAERLDRLPPGFEWTSIPVIPSTKHIREKILLLAVKRGPALSNFELLDILEEDPYTNNTIYHAAHSDYIRLRRLYYEFFDPRQQEALLRVLSYLDDPDFALVDLPHYGLFVTNLLLANCVGLLPSRRKLPSPPRTYAYREQRASTKRLFITALSKSSDSSRTHPARALRPLKAFRRTPPMGFPHRYETPPIAPTLTWRNTNSKGRAILSLSRSSLDIPLSHPSHAKVVFPASLGSLAGPSVATAPARPTTTDSTQSSSPWNVHAVPHDATLPTLPSIVLSGPSGRLTLNFSAPQPTPPAPSVMIYKYGSPASAEPTSSPGDGSPNIYVERLDRLPPGFEWTSIPVIPSTKHIREKILLLAVKRGPALSNFELLDILEEDPYTNDTVYHAAHSDYIRQDPGLS